MKQKSLVWDYFTEKGALAICTKTYNYNLSAAKFSTQPLRYHLKTQRNLSLENTEKCTSSKRPAPDKLLLPNTNSNSKLIDYSSYFSCIEAEPVFSAGGLLAKLRISGNTLDKLMFLKFFFVLKKENLF